MHTRQQPPTSTTRQQPPAQQPPTAQHPPPSTHPPAPAHLVCVGKEHEQVHHEQQEGGGVVRLHTLQGMHCEGRPGRSGEGPVAATATVPPSPTSLAVLPLSPCEPQPPQPPSHLPTCSMLVVASAVWVTSKGTIVSRTPDSNTRRAASGSVCRLNSCTAGRQGGRAGRAGSRAC